MGLPRFFKLPRNQKFDYKPRYWDPRKEALEERLNKYREENKGDTKAVKSRISKAFRSRGGSFQEGRELRAKATRRSNRILIYTIVVLVLIAYLLFNTYLEEIVRMIE